MIPGGRRYDRERLDSRRSQDIVDVGLFHAVRTGERDGDVHATLLDDGAHELIGVQRDSVGMGLAPFHVSGNPTAEFQPGRHGGILCRGVCERGTWHARGLRARDRSKNEC